MLTEELSYQSEQMQEENKFLHESHEAVAPTVPETAVPSTLERRPNSGGSSVNKLKELIQEANGIVVDSAESAAAAEGGAQIEIEAPGEDGEAAELMEEAAPMVPTHKVQQEVEVATRICTGSDMNKAAQDVKDLAAKLRAEGKNDKADEMEELALLLAPPAETI